MNYRHVYHAGNFADVIKHISVICVASAYAKKDKGYGVLDAFGGVGVYDLSCDESMSTGEAFYGYKLLSDGVFDDMPADVAKYLSIAQDLGMYPGSPYILNRMSRTQDHVQVCELHKDDINILKRNAKVYRFNNISVHHMDGYLSLKALLPMKEGRGIVLIDPPFEKNNEFQLIIEHLSAMYKRFRAATTIIWHPIKQGLSNGEYGCNQQACDIFYKNLQSIPHEKLFLTFDISRYYDHVECDFALSKCGVVIINPPNCLEALRRSAEFLCKKVYGNFADFTLVCVQPIGH